MSKRRWMILAAMVLLISSALGVSISKGATHSWTPGGAKVWADSTDFGIEIGSEKISCNEVVGTGTLNKESSEWTVTPTFSNCESQSKLATQIKTHGTWTANDISSNEATLKISTSKEVKEPIVIELGEKCKVVMEEGATLGSEADYLNGENGILEPSLLELTNQTIKVADKPSECLNKATSATINAHMTFLNETSEKEAVKVT